MFAILVFIIKEPRKFHAPAPLPAEETI